MDDENLEIRKNEEKDVPASLEGAPSWSKLLESTGDILDFFVKGLAKYENVEGVLETAEKAAEKYGVIPTKAIEKIRAQDALAFSDAFTFLSVFTSGAEILNSATDIQEAITSEGESTANKILVSLSASSYITEGITSIANAVKETTGSGASKFLGKLAPTAKIAGGTFSVTNAVVDLNEHPGDLGKIAKASCDLTAGVLDVTGGSLELGVATAPLAIPLGILSSSFSIAADFFEEENWGMGFLSIAVGIVATTIISAFMKTVLKTAFKALMQLIKTAFQTTLAPLLANPVTAVVAFGVGILIGELLCSTLPFAQGGFPVRDHAFIAREAGPELVGTLNGRNAVVNNDQIVQSVSRGVSAAFLAAYCKGGFGGGVDVEVYMDGRRLAAAVC